MATTKESLASRSLADPHLVKVQQAKTHFSKQLQEVVIARSGVPIARLLLNTHLVLWWLNGAIHACPSWCWRGHTGTGGGGVREPGAVAGLLLVDDLFRNY